MLVKNKKNLLISVFILSLSIICSLLLFSGCNNNTFSVSFDSNGGSIVQTQTLKKGDKIEDPKCEKLGYTLDGWYLNGEKLDLQDYNVTQSIKLYAVWNINNYCINYINVSDDVINNNPVSYTIEDDNIRLNSINCDNKIFEGWYLDEEFTQQIEVINTSTCDDINLYAKWSGELFNLSFDVNGGSKIPDQKIEYGSDITNLPTTLKNGYNFDGWYTDSELSNSFTMTNMPNRNLILYAKWDIIDFNINYNLNGGLNNESNPLKYNIEDSLITLKNPSKADCEFIGWYSVLGAKEEKITQINPSTLKEINLYAKWRYYINDNNANTFNDILHNKNNLCDDFYLQTDINLDGVIWEPIVGFKGNIYGNGYSISNITIQNSKNTNVGIFEELLNSNFYNINFKSIRIICNDNNNANIGIIAGKIENSSIKNCFIQGIVEVSDKGYVNNFNEINYGNKEYFIGGINGIAVDTTYDGCNLDIDINAISLNTDKLYVGGLIGQCYNTTIDSCNTLGQLSSSYVGGLVGIEENSIISKSYSNCNIIGKDIGGLVYKNLGEINTSYFAGTITNSANDYNIVGGLVSINGGIISNSYTSGEINSKGGECGGLIGRHSYNIGVIYNCYSNCIITTEKTEYIGGLIGRAYKSKILQDCFSCSKIIIKSGSMVNAGLILGYGSWNISSCYVDSSIEIETQINPEWIFANIKVGEIKTSRLELLNHFNNIWDNDMWKFENNTLPVLR